LFYFLITPFFISTSIPFCYFLDSPAKTSSFLNFLKVPLFVREGFSLRDAFGKGELVIFNTASSADGKEEAQNKTGFSEGILWIAAIVFFMGLKPYLFWLCYCNRLSERELMSIQKLKRLKPFELVEIMCC